jgi:hypothetical protein
MRVTAFPCVKFVTKSNYDEFGKGEIGIIVEVLARFPESTDTIYVVQTDRGKRIWCTAKEVVPWNQLSLLPN